MARDRKSIIASIAKTFRAMYIDNPEILYASITMKDVFGVPHIVIFDRETVENNPTTFEAVVESVLVVRDIITEKGYGKDE